MYIGYDIFPPRLQRSDAINNNVYVYALCNHKILVQKHEFNIYTKPFKRLIL